MNDLDVFEREDAISTDKGWLPWSKRIFPALYRLIWVHNKEIDERLSQVMLSSDGIEEDKVIGELLEARKAAKTLFDWSMFCVGFAVLGFTNVLVTRM